MLMTMAAFALLAFFFAVPEQAQMVVSATGAPNGVAPVIDQVAISAIIAWLLEKMKHARSVPWVNTETQQLNTLISAAVAGLAAVGVHAQFDRQGGTMIITGLTVTSIAHLGWEWAKSFVLQEYIRKSALEGRVVAGISPRQALAANATAGSP